MIAWSYDMEAAKREPRVLAAALDNGVPTTFVSRWLPPQKDRPEGRWEFFTAAKPPYAWAPWPEAPEPPETSAGQLSVFD